MAVLVSKGPYAQINRTNASEHVSHKLALGRQATTAQRAMDNAYLQPVGQPRGRAIAVQAAVNPPLADGLGTASDTSSRFSHVKPSDGAKPCRRDALPAIA